MHNLKALLVFILLASISHAELITKGSDIDKVSSAMQEAGYKKTFLSVAPSDLNHKLKFWTVDEGILIARYNPLNKSILDLSYLLTDNRPKATRVTFRLVVRSFDPETGLIQIQTHK